MRILFIAPRLPLPADTGGKIRTFNLVKQAAKVHKIDLVCFSFDASDARHARELLESGIAVTLVPAQEPNFIQKIGSILLACAPYSVTKYYSKKMEEAIRKLTGENSYDMAHFDHIHMTHYDKFFDSRPCLVDEHNVEYRILERCADVEKSFIKKNLFIGQARKMKQFEAKKISSFSACSAVSDEDGKVLMHLTRNKKPVYTLPNGVDTEYFRVQGTGYRVQVEENALVFTGSMDWLPNDDAAIYFCEDILPRLWTINPNIKFYIVGKGPSDRLKELAKDEQRIILTGRVDDVRPLMARSKVFVVPLRIGGGTRLKILEAMSMGKAVVSTSIGAEGIDYTEDADIVLADRPEAFAQKIVSLFNDNEKRKALGAAGRKLVLEKYDWNIVGEQLNRIYEDLTHVKSQQT